MNCNPELSTVLQSIKNEYGVRVFRTARFVSIFQDKAPDLMWDSKFFSRLIEKNYIKTITKIAKVENVEKRESKIKRLEDLIENNEFISTERSDAYIRALINTLRRDDTGPPSPLKQLKRGVLTIVKLIGAIILISYIESAISSPIRDIRNTGYHADPTKNLYGYLGKNIYEAAEQIDETEKVEQTQYLLHLKYTAKMNENGTVSFSLGASTGQIVNYLSLRCNTPGIDEGYNICGIAPGMGKVQVEEILKSQGFEVKTNSTSNVVQGFKNDIHLDVLIGVGQGVNSIEVSTEELNKQSVIN